MNTPECNFDGGDCCGHCGSITLTLENNALVAKDYLEGVYHNSSKVNGKPSWISTSNAIWFAEGFWLIGYLDGIGQSSGGIYSNYVSQCPFDLSSEKWHYSDNGWKSAGPNEIKLECLIGNFPK